MRSRGHWSASTSSSTRSPSGAGIRSRCRWGSCTRSTWSRTSSSTRSATRASRGSAIWSSRWCMPRSRSGCRPAPSPSSRAREPGYDRMEFAIQVAGGQVRTDTTGIEAIVEQAVMAEALGFGTVFVPDHYVFESLGTVQTELPAYEMTFVMATLAQRTRTIRIGSHVACVLFRHPALLARQFAQIDEASGGRLVAGVGAGWTRAEFVMMGIDFPPVSERLAILDEAVLVMRGLWGEEPFSFAGK